MFRKDHVSGVYQMRRTLRDSRYSFCGRGRTKAALELLLRHFILFDCFELLTDTQGGRRIRKRKDYSVLKKRTTTICYLKEWIAYKFRESFRAGGCCSGCRWGQCDALYLKLVLAVQALWWVLVETEMN